MWRFCGCLDIFRVFGLEFIFTFFLDNSTAFRHQVSRCLAVILEGPLDTHWVSWFLICFTRAKASIIRKQLEASPASALQFECHNVPTLHATGERGTLAKSTRGGVHCDVACLLVFSSTTCILMCNMPPVAAVPTASNLDRHLRQDHFTGREMLELNANQLINLQPVFSIPLGKRSLGPGEQRAWQFRRATCMAIQEIRNQLQGPPDKQSLVTFAVF